MTRSLLIALSLALVAACGGDDDSCPKLTELQAQPGDDIDGDTYATFASDFFGDYCTRCHSSNNTGDARNGAPVGFNWDQEASVRSRLPLIRAAVGVSNFMPPSAPTPSCEDRQRLVRWIDAAAP